MVHFLRVLIALIACSFSVHILIDASIKAQLQSLRAVRKKCDDRLHAIRDSRITPLQAETIGLSKFYKKQPGQKLPDLSIDKVLTEPNAGNCYLGKTDFLSKVF